MQKRLALLATVALAACANTKIPLPTGLTVKRNITTASTSTSFIKRGTNAPVESSASLTVAPSCATVLEAAATEKVVTNKTGTDSWEVLGQTNAAHPLVPNNDTFAPQQVSIIKALNTETGEFVTTTTTFTPGPPTERVTNTSTSAINVVGNASYLGMAVDEYYVMLDSLGGLWTEIDQNATQNPEPASLEGQGFAAGLLTRYEPKKGDIWSSTNGRFLYFADGTEELTISGKKFTTNRIKVYTVASLDPVASDVLASCVTELKRDTTTTAPGGDPESAPLAFLNPACANSFVHALDGTEWWYKGALVKANYTRNTVEIGDMGAYGYEYTTNDFPTPGSCTRNISQNRPTGDVTSTLFVQYTVNTSVIDVLATELKEAAQ